MTPQHAQRIRDAIKRIQQLDDARRDTPTTPAIPQATLSMVSSN